MSFYSGLDFFSWLIVMLIPAIIIGIWQSKHLRIYRYVADIVFIYLVYKGDVIQLCYLIGYAILTLYAVKIFLWICKSGKNSGFILGTVLAVVLSPLIIYKLSLLFESSIFGFLGISYICFRAIQTVIEVNDGLISEIKPIQYLGFLLFFPSLSSGPIDRSRRYCVDDEKTVSRDEYLTLLEAGVFKLVLGAFYKIVCADICYGWLTNNFAEISLNINFLARMYVYGLYLFFDFAGYSAMAVGTAYILGIRLPDNFHLPFISTDMKDFWNRWHISLSTWLRDFVFNRFLKNAIRQKWFKNRLNAACAGFMLNMFIMGVWHGLSTQYIAYGIYHGVILALTEIYQKKSDFHKKNNAKLWYKVGSWFITINLVMIGFSIFSGDVEILIHQILIGKA